MLIEFEKDWMEPVFTRVRNKKAGLKVRGNIIDIRVKTDKFKLALAILQTFLDFLSTQAAKRSLIRSETVIFLNESLYNQSKMILEAIGFDTGLISSDEYHRMIFGNEYSKLMGLDGIHLSKLVFESIRKKNVKKSVNLLKILPKSAFRHKDHLDHTLLMEAIHFKGDLELVTELLKMESMNDRVYAADSDTEVITLLLF
eukprot:TRINITY_DN3769_c0_g4_i2.p1 TRINITY_DN3769_c0_g4~~TRINITY_DN3769_c0_g4_i2.p1  ORF type:complete len:217 (+),score=34.85 TRINITY_DN3769_c0_g4_i2:54-653(+)